MSFLNKQRELFGELKDYFLPANDGKFNSLERKDFDSMITTTLALAFVAAFWTVYCYLLDFKIMAFGCSFSPPILVTALFVLKKRSNYLLSAHLVLFSILATLAVVHYASGLGNAPSIFWLAFYPVLAVVVIGPKWAYLWSGLAVLFIILSEAWRVKTGHEFTEYTPQLLFYTNIANLVVGIPFLCFFVGYSHRIKNRTLEEREMLISAMSHDLANPVSGLTFAVENIRSANQKEDTEKTYKSIEHLDEITKRLRTSIEVIRGFRKTGSFNVYPINWKDIKARIDKAFCNSLKDKNINLVYDTSRYDGSPVFGNIEVLTNHVLQNIVENAIKFSYRGSTVKVSVISDGSSTSIQVEDDGVGIDSVTKVLKGNHSTEGTAGEIGSGLGIQAAIMHLQRLMGSLSVESKVGKGSKFIVTLKTWSKKYE